MGCKALESPSMSVENRTTAGPGSILAQFLVELRRFRVSSLASFPTARTARRWSTDAALRQ